MAVKFTNGIDLDKTALQNAVLHPVGSDPSSPADGQIWYRTDTDTLHVRANGITETVSFGDTGLMNIVEDTTPQLGGQLDVNGNAIGDGTRELLTFVEDALAVNHLEIENEATGSGPILRSTGDDTNVDLHFDTKGSGAFVFTGSLTVTGTVDGRDVSVDGSKLDGIEALADVTDAANVDAAGATMNSDTTLVGNGYFLDEDNMASDSAAKVPSQQSVKAYVDAAAAQATETVRGTAEVATQAEADAGTSDTVMLTPLKLDALNPTAMGWFIDEDSFATDSAVRVPSQQSVKAYVASQISGFSTYRGGYNASTNSPDLDTAPSGVQQGDQYTVTVAGTFFTTAVEVGDLLIAEIDNASVEADWTIVNRNLDAASTTVAGIVELATAAETIARTDAARAVTPLSLATFPVKYSALIGNGADTAIIVTHNLGTKDITVAVRDAATDNHVICDVQSTTTNTATFTFAVAPTSNAYSVTIIG